MRLIFWLNGWLVRILCVVAVVVIAAMAIGALVWPALVWVWRKLKGEAPATASAR